MLKNKKNIVVKSSKLYLLGALTWLFILSSGTASSVFAASTTSSKTSTSSSSSSSSGTDNSPFIQSYNAATDLQQGMIVQLEQKSLSSVAPASQNTIYKTLGVVVNLSSASIAVENEDKSGTQVFAATNGHYDVLVSDQNGAINPGDYITVSALSGIGMKDDNTEPIVVAQALASFNGTGPIIGSTKIKTSNGNVTVHFGLVKASISIGHNPLLVTSNSAVPRVLQKFANAAAGKNVSTWRIWLGISILSVVAFIVGSMLYGAVKSSLISIGRNPLSKKAITKGFVEVILSALIIFTSAVFGVYLLLKV